MPTPPITAPFTLELDAPALAVDLDSVAAGQGALTAKLVGLQAGDSLQQMAFTAAPAAGGAPVVTKTIDFVARTDGQLTAVSLNALQAKAAFSFQPSDLDAIRAAGPCVYAVRAWVLRAGVTVYHDVMAGRITAAANPTTVTALLRVASVTITGNPSGAPGGTSQLTATVRDSQGNVVALTVTWTSSNPMVASVDANGLVSQIAPGTAAITATCQGIAALVMATVTDPGFTNPPNGASPVFRTATGKWAPEQTAIDALVALDTASAVELNAGNLFGVFDLTNGVMRALGLARLIGIIARFCGVYLVTDPKFGALGNGSSDDSAGFNNAIIACNAAGGGYVDVPATLNGYKVLSLALLPNVTLRLAPGATLIKNGGAVGTCIVNLTGATTATSTTLTANAAIGDTSLAVTSSAGFSADDLVLVYDSTYKYSTSGRNQEINRVVSTGVGSIVLENRLLGAYATASTAAVVKLSAIENAHIVGGTLKIPTGTNGGGVYGVLTSDCSVDRTQVIGPNDMPGIRFDQSRGARLVYARVRDGQTPATQGTSYGWIFNESCHDCEAVGVRTRNVRENPISNNGRHILVLACSDDGSTDSSFNTHGTGNEHVRFIGCRSISPKQYGFYASQSANNAADTDVSFDNCEVYRAGKHGFVSDGAVGKEPKNISWSNCKVDGFGVTSPSSAGLLISRVIGFQVIGGDYSGASISTNTTQAIYALNAQKGQILAPRARDVANGYGLQMQDCTDVLIVAPRFANISSYNIRDVGTNTNVRLQGADADDALFSFVAISGFLRAPGVSGDRGDASVTVTSLDEAEQRFDTALTANRTLTLPTATSLPMGSRIRAVRTGLGAFTLTVQDATLATVKVLPSATAAAVEATLTTSGWKLSSYTPL